MGHIRLGRLPATKKWQQVVALLSRGASLELRHVVYVTTAALAIVVGRLKVARIFNTYGPRMHAKDGRVVSNFIVQALKQDPITIFGDGLQTRSFCYVDDMIGALVAFMESGVPLTGPMNFGNPVESTMLELAELILRLTGSRSEVVFKPLSTDDPRQRCPDITLAKQHLDWSPQVPLEDGLKETIAYFRRELGR